MAIVITRTSPPAVIAGLTAVADYGFAKCYNSEGGILVDRTLEFQNGATPVESFIDINSYIYLGCISDITYNSSVSDGRFISVYINLDTVASSSILPTFEYNTGNNTWATLAVVDGTNGFTQNGEISVVLDSLPTYTGWANGSQDGSGNEIGDGVDRRYIRIKRTQSVLVTAPKIKEAGTGELTANKTYYYRANSMSSPPVYVGNYNSNHLQSAPCSEISATTTEYKRSIKISWSSDNLHHSIWRTPISGNYTNSSSVKSITTQIDSNCQSVRGKYFNANTTNFITDTSIIDNGLHVLFERYGTSTTAVFSYYASKVFPEYERGQISVSGGTLATPVKFLDIYNASISGAWGSFIPISNSDSNAIFHAWDCRDNLVINDYITGSSFQIILRGSLYSYSATTFMTFGEAASYTNASGQTKYFYRNGGTFTIINGITAGYNCYFANCKMYDCRIEQGCLDNDGHTYISVPVFIGDNNRLYKCVLNGGGIVGLEGASFSGTGLILDDVTINGSRYGLQINAESFATATFNNITITGGVGIRSDYIPNGSNIIWQNFTFKLMSSRLHSCYLTSSSKDKTVNEYFLNPIIDTVASGILSRSWVGINYTLYEQYSLDILVQDKAGQVIVGALIKIYDNNKNELFGKVTDENGIITTSNITYKKYTAGTLNSVAYYTYIADAIESYPIHTVQISKAGYKTKTINYTMNKKREETETLETEYTTSHAKITIM
jgi:hypothetical protein